jgi:hypothetical protein
VRAGRALWQASDVIRFVASDPRVLAIAAIDISENIRRANYDKATASGLATTREMANIPITCPGVALNFGRRSAGCGPLHGY